MAKPDPQRLMALDVGDRRIGVAVGFAETGIARPLEVLDRAGGDQAVFQRLRRIVRDEGVGTILVGDPINMDDSVGPRAEISRAFADTVAKAIRQAKVLMHDERLSSFDADERMAAAGIKPADRRRHRDAYAAASILEDYFRQQKPED